MAMMLSILMNGQSHIDSFAIGEVHSESMTNSSIDDDTRRFAAPDSLNLADSLQYCARRYLERSFPDRAIPLLMKALKVLSGNNQDASHATIELCEAYRQKQEYAKAKSLLYGLLSKADGLSEKNRCYALNRLAAIFNESSTPVGSYTDSVVKYSLLGLAIALKTGDKPALATAQNELSLQYMLRKEYPKALELSKKSITGFQEAGMPYNAMNALVVQSNIYLKTGEFSNALGALNEATKLAPFHENRNLYMRIYRQYANVYAAKGQFKEAYEFQLLCNKLQNDFFSDRMNNQIVEQSARFDLFVKEQQLREEQKKNEFIHKQFILLVILIIAIILVFLILIFYFRMKRKGALKQKLMEAVVETENNERRRIARDLHDGLGPVLSAINHYFQAYLDAEPGNRKSIQTRLQMVISEAIDEVSRISHNISPHVLEKHGLLTALNNLFAPLSMHGSYEIVFDPGNFERAEPRIELALYRSIAELLNNTLKHARASRISLEMKVAGDQLHLHYSDNGIGFDISTRSREGMGFPNIASRVESSGGSLTIASNLNAGINVHITMPL